jgi:hypothetical protein
VTPITSLVDDLITKPFLVPKLFPLKVKEFSGVPFVLEQEISDMEAIIARVRVNKVFFIGCFV